MQIYKDILTDDKMLSDAFASTPFAYAGKQIDGVVCVQSRTVAVDGEKFFDVAKGPQGFGYVPIYRTITDFASRHKTWGRRGRAALEARVENTAAFSTAATAGVGPKFLYLRQALVAQAG